MLGTQSSLETLSDSNNHKQFKKGFQGNQTKRVEEKLTTRLFDLFPVALKEEVFQNRKNQNKNKVQRSSSQGLVPVKSSEYAFERLKKLPLDSLRQVQSALNHFFNVKGVTPGDLDIAFEKVKGKANQLGLCTMGLCRQYEAFKAELSQKDLKADE
jgi:hypothetical protein